MSSVTIQTAIRFTLTGVERQAEFHLYECGYCYALLRDEMRLEMHESMHQLSREES